MGVPTAIWQLHQPISGNSISHCGNNISHKNHVTFHLSQLLPQNGSIPQNVTITSVTKALMAIHHKAITSAKHGDKQQLTITSVKSQSKLAKICQHNNSWLTICQQYQKFGNKFKYII